MALPYRVSDDGLTVWRHTDAVIVSVRSFESRPQASVAAADLNEAFGRGQAQVMATLRKVLKLPPLQPGESEW